MTLYKRLAGEAKAFVASDAIVRCGKKGKEDGE
jgi:hypothetical protein